MGRSQVIEDRGPAIGSGVASHHKEPAGCPDPEWENRKVSGILDEILAGSASGNAVPVSLGTAAAVVRDLAVMLRQELTALNLALASVSSIDALAARPVVLAGKTTPSCPAAADLMDTAGNLLDLYFVVGEIRNNLRIS